MNPLRESVNGKGVGKMRCGCVASGAPVGKGEYASLHGRTQHSIRTTCYCQTITKRRRVHPRSREATQRLYTQKRNNTLPLRPGLSLAAAACATSFRSNTASTGERVTAGGEPQQVAEHARLVGTRGVLRDFLAQKPLTVACLKMASPELSRISSPDIEPNKTECRPRPTG